MPQQIGQTSPGVWGLAVDDVHVYFCGADVSNDSPQNVYRTEKDGSGSLQLVATGQIRCNEVFLDGNFVYWANQGTRDTYTEGSVWRASLDDLEPELVAGNRERPRDIEADQTHIWWIEAGPANPDPGGALYRIPK